MAKINTVAQTTDRALSALLVEEISSTENNIIEFAGTEWTCIDREEQAGDRINAYVEIKDRFETTDLDLGIRFYRVIKQNSKNSTFNVEYQRLTTIDGIQTWRGPQGSDTLYYTCVLFEDPDAAKRVSAKMPKDEVFLPENGELIQELFDEMVANELAKSAGQKVDERGISYRERQVPLLAGWNVTLRLYPSRASLSLTKRQELSGVMLKIAQNNGRPTYSEELIILDSYSMQNETYAAFAPEREGNSLAIDMNTELDKVKTTTGTRPVTFREAVKGAEMSEAAVQFVLAVVAEPAAYALSEKLGREILPTEISPIALSYNSEAM